MGEDDDAEILERGVLSESTDSEDEGLEFAGMGADPYFSVADIDPAVFSNDPDFQL